MVLVACYLDQGHFYLAAGSICSIQYKIDLGLFYYFCICRCSWSDLQSKVWGVVGRDLVWAVMVLAKPGCRKKLHLDKNFRFIINPYQVSWRSIK